ncbi:MAG: hypothetical protein ACKV2T_15570 [Kofleriaceae bacterium]
MRSVAILCAFALAGCYDDTPGLRLVIQDPGVGAVTVELFLATRPSMANAIGANAARMNEGRIKLPGDSFYLDGPGDGTTPLTVLDVVDGKVVWNLQADPDGPSEMKLVVAVAYDAQGEAVGVAKMSDVKVPVNDTVAYVLELQQARQLAPSPNKEPAGLRVWPWRKANAPTTAACLGLEHSDGEGRVERIWLVPEDDPDCDEVAVECDEFYWRANQSGPVNVGNANCFEGSPVPISGGGTLMTDCRLGARACVDGVPPGTCVAFDQPRYCVANALCNPGLCLARPEMCVNAVQSSTYAICDLPTMTNGAPCADTGNIVPLTIDLSPIAQQCRAADFVAWDTIAGGVAPSPTHVHYNATFTISNLDPTECTFDVTMTGVVENQLARTILLALDVTLATDHLLIPVVLTSQGGDCDVQPSCTIVNGVEESLESCN